jgi:2-polyprenyl-3-methyl-5-hydroxy-6-metoxy-1,4-benzoquinol methylase
MLNTPEDSVRKFIETQYIPGNSKDIQIFCPHSEIKEMFGRIRVQWARIGEVEPYASVLSEEKYKSISIKAHIGEFHETGKLGIGNLNSMCLKNDIELPGQVLFELGCGVGRSTQFFSPSFERVHAWDVSAGNLRECRNNLDVKGIENVETRLIDQIEDYASVPPHDVFFSEIVIQHNPPPLQYYLLDKVLSRLNPGGVFFFQTITHHSTYAFNVRSYLNWEHNQDFEMHALPMRWVNRVIRKNGLFLLDVVKERLGGFGLDSHTFFGIRQN